MNSIAFTCFPDKINNQTIPDLRRRKSIFSATLSNLRSPYITFVREVDIFLVQWEHLSSAIYKLLSFYRRGPLKRPRLICPDATAFDVPGETLRNFSVLFFDLQTPPTELTLPHLTIALVGRQYALSTLVWINSCLLIFIAMCEHEHRIFSVL
jgi:hypothetical protein